MAFDEDGRSACPGDTDLAHENVSNKCDEQSPRGSNARSGRVVPAPGTPSDGEERGPGSKTPPVRAGLFRKLGRRKDQAPDLSGATVAAGRGPSATGRVTMVAAGCCGCAGAPERNSVVGMACFFKPASSDSGLSW